MINIFELYEDLKKYTIGQDNLFYDAPEGEFQLDVIKAMLLAICNQLDGGK